MGDSEIGTGDCGVCLGGYDGDGPEFYNSKIVKARKPHQCYECEKEIPVGQSYERVVGKWDGDISTFEFCLICSEIAEALSCGGRCFGNLWDDAEQNLFPNMTTGCLSKLRTASAKQALVERWRRWEFGDPMLGSGAELVK